MNPWSLWSRDPWSWFWKSKSFTSPWDCRIPIWKKITFKGVESNSHSFQLWLKVSMQNKQLREYKPCKMLFCSFVPFQTGVKPRKKQTPFEKSESKNNLVILNLRVGSRSFLKGMNKILVQSVCVLQLLHLMEPSCGHVIRCALKPSCPLCRAQSPPQKLLPLLHYAAPVWTALGVAKKKTCDLRQGVFNLTENDSENQQVRFSIFHDGLLLPSSINKSEHAFCGGGRFWGPTIAYIYIYFNEISTSAALYRTTTVFVNTCTVHIPMSFTWGE